MKIQHKNKTILQNVIECSTVWSKTRGFMFSNNQKKSLLFEFYTPRRIDLHNCFVKFSLDLFFLNEKKKVIEIKKAFKPWKFYISKKKASYVLEVPSVQKLNLKKGDILTLKK